MGLLDGKTLSSVETLPELNSGLIPLSFRAGWDRPEPSLYSEPRGRYVPEMWSWALAKAGLDAAGRLISTDLADRRNLFMVNPIEGNFYSTLRTLVAAYQMILPGEKARSHRHTPHALRLVLDGQPGAYTVVDGVRIDMLPGDVVLTPGWCWHGHGSDSDGPAYWIDFLDVPLVHLLEPMFLEHWPGGYQPAEDAWRPADLVFSAAEVDARLPLAPLDEFGRRRLQLWPSALPTIDLTMEGLAAGRAGPCLRSTENQILAVTAGQGRTVVGDKAFHWSRGDVVAVPAWTRFTHHAESDAVLFCVSDRPVMEKLGYFRIERADAAPP